MKYDPIQFHDFQVDLASSDQDNLFVNVRGFAVAIITTDEGIVIDVYPRSDADEPIASTYAFDSDVPTHEGEQR
jgi:hypothetical protein